MKPTRIRVATQWDATQAAIEAHRLFIAQGASPVLAAKFRTAVSELAGNIIKYADSGDAAFAEIERGGDRGLQVTVRDRGPGIADIEAALRDHYSSGGTLGLGLPGVKRMMDEFELDSSPGEGTRVAVAKWL